MWTENESEPQRSGQGGGGLARPSDLHLSQKRKKRVTVRKLKIIASCKALREQCVRCGDVPAAPRSVHDISVDDKQKFRCQGKWEETRRWLCAEHIWHHIGKCWCLRSAKWPSERSFPSLTSSKSLIHHHNKTFISNVRFNCFDCLVAGYESPFPLYICWYYFIYCVMLYR